MLVLGFLACFGRGDPPVVDSVEVSREFLGEGGDVDVTVQVTDPNEDVVAITIVDGRTGMELASADVTDESSPYVVNVTWDDFVALEALDFESTELRRMQVMATDDRDNTSELVVGEITLRCRQAGGVGLGDRCYNVAVNGAPAMSTCAEVCEGGEFECDDDASKGAFGQVGMVDFIIDDNGTKLPVTLDILDCLTPASSITFDTSQGPSTINGTSRITWTCYCVP